MIFHLRCFTKCLGPTESFPVALSIFMLLAASGCVTVNLPKGSEGRSPSVEIQEPSKAFESIKSENADRAWKHSQSGATISFLSDCNDNPDSLQNFESDSLNALKSAKVLKSESTRINNREGQRIQILGALEGIPMKMELLAFRKNGCDYILSFVARQTAFDLQLTEFDKFIAGFQAP